MCLRHWQCPATVQQDACFHLGLPEAGTLGLVICQLVRMVQPVYADATATAWVPMVQVLSHVTAVLSISSSRSLLHTTLTCPFSLAVVTSSLGPSSCWGLLRLS